MKPWEDEHTQPDAMAALPMRELVYGPPAAPWSFLMSFVARLTVVAGAPFSTQEK